MTDQRTPAGGGIPAPMNRRDFEARIVANAWRDPKYRDALCKDPKAVLQRELSTLDPSIALPAALQVQVHEETPDSYHLVLPRNPRDITLHELVGDHLEAVAPQTVAVVVVNVGPVTSASVVSAMVNANAVTTTGWINNVAVVSNVVTTGVYVA